VEKKEAVTQMEKRKTKRTLNWQEKKKVTHQGGRPSKNPGKRVAKKIFGREKPRNCSKGGKKKMEKKNGIDLNAPTYL